MNNYNSYQLTWQGFTSNLNANDALNLVFDFTRPQHVKGELRKPYIVGANFSISNLFEIKSYGIVSKRQLDYYNSTQKPSAYNPNYNTAEEFGNWWKRGIEINWANAKEKTYPQNPLQMLIDWSLPNVEYYTPATSFWSKGIINQTTAFEGIANRGNNVLNSNASIEFSIIGDGHAFQDNSTYVITKDGKPLELEGQSVEGRLDVGNNATINIKQQSTFEAKVEHSIGVKGDILSQPIISKAEAYHPSVLTIKSNAQIDLNLQCLGYVQHYENVKVASNAQLELNLQCIGYATFHKAYYVQSNTQIDISIECNGIVRVDEIKFYGVFSNAQLNLNIQSLSNIQRGNKVEYSKGKLFEIPGQFLHAEHDNTKDPFARGNFAWLDNIVGYNVYNTENYSRADVYYIVSSNAEINVSPITLIQHTDGVNAIVCVYQLAYNPKTFNDWNAWYRGRIKYGVPTAPRIEQIFEMSSRQKDIKEHKRIKTILEDPVYPVYLPTTKFNQRYNELNSSELQINFTHREEFKHVERIEVWLEDKVTGKQVRLDKFNKYYNNEGIYSLKEHVYEKPYVEHPWQTTKFSIPIVLPAGYNCQIVTQYRPRDRWDNHNVLRPGYTRKEVERRVLRFNPKFQTLPSYEYLNIGDHISFQPSTFGHNKSLEYDTTKQHKIVEVYKDYFKASFLQKFQTFKSKFTRNTKIVEVYEDKVLKISYFNQIKLLKTKYTKQKTGQVGG